RQPDRAPPPSPPTRRSSDLREAQHDERARAGAQSHGDDGRPRLAQREAIALQERRIRRMGVAAGRADLARMMVMMGMAVHLDCLDRKSTRLNSSHVKISYAV